MNSQLRGCALCLLSQLCILVTQSSYLLAQEAVVSVERSPGVSFVSDILPILQSQCLDCHNESSRESELALDSMLSALRGGDSGAATIIPGDSATSHLIERVAHADAALRMPPDSDGLSVDELQLLKAWIDDAAAWREAVAALSQDTLKHWSLLPLERPTIPDTSQAHPVDAFIEQPLHAVGLSFSAQASQQRLIRRLYLVMHGLPPTRAQVTEFLADTRPDAWEHLVERLLESPRYGERWAAHWLDVVRFGETDGFETNRERPTAYHYRDWVIDAFNSDKPYDQFIKEQLAGDAMGEPIGTAFLVAGPHDIVKGQDALLGLMQRQDELTDMVNTTGTAFLGLTTGCARCHNHKFDPISQKDFYALQAVFSGVEFSERELPLSKSAESQLAELDAEITGVRGELLKYARQSATRPPVNARSNNELFSKTRARHVRFTILASSASEPCIDELEVFAGDVNVGLASAGAIATSSGNFEHPLHQLKHINDGRHGNAHSWIASAATGGWVALELASEFEIERIVWGRDREGMFGDRLATNYRVESSLDGEQWQLLASSEDRLPFSTAAELKDQYDLSNLSTAEAAAVNNLIERMQTLHNKRNGLASSNRVFAGSFRDPDKTFRLHRGDPTAPREPIGPGAIDVLGTLELPPDATEQQRRLALAKWIARPDHPLTARVMVNRLWHYQFGSGLVDTPSDLGANGSSPTHPELLDWLASEFIQHGWSIKHLQRLILTSKTWKQDSAPDSTALAVDASSRLLWRFPPRRLEAEGIRDCILAASGRLDFTTGGPGFSAFEVELENVRHYFPKKDFGPSDWRRMIYMTKVRQEKDAVFGIFDCPDGSQVTPKRGRSTTPLQALNLFNSRFVIQQAEMLAERLAVEAVTDESRVGLAYELCFGRLAEASEVAEGLEFIAQQGWGQFARAMLNANEFVFIP